MRFNILALLLSVFCVAITSVAHASDPKELGVYGDWTAYSFMENGNKVCYMASQPKTAVGNYTRRGDIFALITHRPAENTKNVFSYMTGYSYKQDSSVNIDIGGRKFNLFTQGDTAWAADAAADNALTSAIKAGSAMIVKGTSSRGTLTTDSFGLSGSSKAYQKISAECGV
ncbi:MAG: invasion associated locus B family protein [Pseudomonadota bacterium]